MKTLLSILFAGLLTSNCFSQENKIAINTIENNKEDLIKQVYKYSKFIVGTIYFKNSQVGSGLLNYKRSSNQMHYINDSGDTLSILNPQDLEKIIINQDTFYFSKKGYVEKISHFATVNLLKKELLKYMETERKGAFGLYSAANSSVQSATPFTNNVNKSQSKSVDENMIYQITNEYFLSDGDNIIPANKKSFSKLFSKSENELKSYLKDNPVNFSNEDDLQNLLAYLSNLK